MSEKKGRAPQRWTLQVGAHQHEVSAQEISWTKRETTWRIDGQLVAANQSGEDKVVLTPGKSVKDREDLAVRVDDVPLGAGAVRVVYTALGVPRRAVWFEGEAAPAAAHTGIGGVDLEPEAGSPAADYEARASARPRLYASRHVAGGVGKVVLPIIGVWLLARLAGLLPDVNIPWPDLPSIPWPDLPDIPWPDINLPSIPWPDWQVPGWLRWILDNAKFVVPILIGLGLYQAEIKRRAEAARRREEARAVRRTVTPETDSPAPEDTPEDDQAP